MDPLPTGYGSTPLLEKAGAHRPARRVLAKCIAVVFFFMKPSEIH